MRLQNIFEQRFLRQICMWVDVKKYPEKIADSR